jgi:hypothetical protein
MASQSEKVDFFISRRGSAEEAAHETAEALRSAGYAVFEQNSDIAYADSFLSKMNEALRRGRPKPCHSSPNAS